MADKNEIKFVMPVLSHEWIKKSIETQLSVLNRARRAAKSGSPVEAAYGQEISQLEQAKADLFRLVDLS